MKAPTFLKDLRGWMVWKFVKTPEDKKPRKVPYYISGKVRTGTQGNNADRENLASFKDALHAYNTGEWSGIGFAMLPDWGIVALDFDDAVDSAGNILPEVEELITGTYAEWSPSGKGVHAFMRGAIADKKSHADGLRFGFETFCGSGFLTFTGNPVPVCELLGSEDDLLDLSQGVLDLFAERFPGVSTQLAAVGDDDPLMTYSPPLGATDEEIREWLSLLNPCMGYHEWLKVGMSIHHETAGEVRGLDLWDEWSAKGGEVYPGRRVLEAKWDRFGRLGNRAPVTIRGVRREALKAKHKDDVVLDSKDFMEAARRFVDMEYQGDEGTTILRNKGLWYRHCGPHWEELPDEELRAHLWKWLDASKKLGKDGDIEPYRPNKAQVENNLDALRAVSMTPSAAAPCWLPGYSGPEPGDLISLSNGILHIESRRLIPHSAAYFTLNSLPYGWDDECQATNWLRFLDQVLPGDQEAKDTLQEMFGYLLTADTSQQKMFLVIGPKRSGKGTIGRVLGALVGRANLVSPTLSSLPSQFGLQPLINKLVALVPDARVSSRSDTQAIVEKLLMVSGEDDITVDRKHNSAWSGRLSARFVILTNETPQLGDSSGALAGRFITIAMSQSFYGREDHSLSQKLMTELPAIFRWALDGLDRLRQRGYFKQPESGREAAEEMSDLNSPVSAFVKERCELGYEFVSSTDELFAAWREWCYERGRVNAWNKDIFCKNLRAGFSGLQQTRPRVDGRQVSAYAGIRLILQVADELV